MAKKEKNVLKFVFAVIALLCAFSLFATCAYAKETEKYGKEAPTTMAPYSSHISNIAVRQTEKIIENDSWYGYYATDEDENTFFCYDDSIFWHCFEYTVYFDDGRSPVCGDYNSIYWDHDINISPDSDQYALHWTVGNNTAFLSCDGYFREFEVEISASPVKSITAVQTCPLYEGVDGEYDGPDFIYNIENVFDVTVEFNDDTKALTGKYENVNKALDYRIDFIADQYEQPWKIGSNTVALELYGKKCEFSLEIKENPVASVSAANVRPVDFGKDCIYFNSANVSYEPELWGRRGFVEGSVVFDYTVQYKDGTSKTFTYHHCCNEEKYVPECEYHGFWGENFGYLIGDENNVIHFVYMAHPFDVTVTVGNCADGEAAFGYIVQNNEAYITDYTGNKTELTIPGTLGGKKVVGILDLSLGNDTALNFITKLTLPDSVKNIAATALSRLTGLREIYLGANAANISASDFDACDLLENIKISASNPLYTVYDGALYDKKMQKLVVYPESRALNESCYTVPDTVSDIFAYLDTDFAGDISVGAKNPYFASKNGVLFSKDMKTLIRCDTEKAGAYAIPESVNTIATAAFANCSQLTSVKIPSGVTEIVYYTFFGCYSLESIDIPVSVKNIGEQALAATGLSSVDLPGVETFAAGCFFGIESVRFGDKLTEIPDYAFSESELREIRFPAGLKKIGREAFTGCDLEKVVLPDSLTQLAEGAFNYCWNLETVTFGSGLKEIPSQCFSFCDSLKSVVLPANIEKVGKEAFFEAGLTDVKIENPDIVITADAFRNCDIHELKAGDRVLLAGIGVVKKNGGFEFAPGVTDIVYRELEYDWQEYYDDFDITVVPSSVRHIGALAFCGVDVGENADGVTYVGNAVIDGRGYTGDSLKIREKTRIIADDAFDFGGFGNMDGGTFKSVILPEGLEYIGSYTFCRNSVLEKAELPSTLKEIGTLAFWRTQLSSVNIPASLTRIGDYAFCDTKISSITVDPNNTAFTVKNGALYTKDLSELIYCPASAAQNGFAVDAKTKKLSCWAFYDVPAGAKIYIPGSVTELSQMMIGRKISDFISTGPDPDNLYTDTCAVPMLYVERGSKAEEFAKKQCVPFEYYDSGKPFITTIRLAAIPAKTVYAPGEKLDLTGLKINAVYNNGSLTALTKYDVQGFDPNRTGTQRITVTYDAFSTAFDVAVGAVHTHTPAAAVKEKVVNATCKAAGSYEEVVYCSVCHAEMSRVKKTVAQLTKHSFDSGVVTLAPTYKADGVKTFTCKVCGKTTIEKIAKLTVENVVIPGIAAEKDNLLKGHCKTTAETVKKDKYVEKILKTDGTELKDNENIGTGMTVVKVDGSAITVVVAGDNDGDGNVSANDARTALRRAVNLEKFAENSVWYMASDIDGEGVSSADARLILRAAVGLENPETW